MLCTLNEGLEKALRDQIVIGVYKDDTRKRLLANTNLTLQKALDLISIEEQVEKDAQCFHNPRTSQDVCYNVRYDKPKCRTSQQNT